MSSCEIIMRLLDGQETTEQEQQCLATTASDVVKLLPLLIVMVVPFLELALPVLLCAFPDMLPTTFRRRAETAESVLDAAEDHIASVGASLNLQAEAIVAAAESAAKGRQAEQQASVAARAAVAAAAAAAASTQITDRD